LTIDFIKAIPEDKILAGGVKDFGKFSEGFCFQVNTIFPDYIFTPKAGEAQPVSGTPEVWLICTDDLVSKSNLMNTIIKLKIKKQQLAGLHITLKVNLKKVPKMDDGTLSGQIPCGAGDVTSVEDLGKPKAKRPPKDGRWIVLQDWTPCSLKCGGGQQTLQLICMPPERGGKPCQGESIRKRPCNTQPCPVLKSPDEEKNAKYEKPIVKVMPISNRPIRYDKCHLKENDIFAVLKPKGFDLMEEIGKNTDFIHSESIVKTPVRIIMNNKSISFYKDENYTSMLLSMNLEGTNFVKITSNKGCFLFQGKLLDQQAVVCDIEQKPGFVEEWFYDFNLFKNQCKEERPVFKLKDDSDIKKKFNARLKKIKQELLEEKVEKARQQSQKEEELSINKKVEKTQAMTVLAIQKELKLEQLLEKEEALREKEEEKQLDLQYKAEQQKKEVLMKSIKEKELEEQYTINKENAEMAIKKLKEEAKSVITNKRIEIKKKIAQMRLKSERKKASIKSKIMSMRSDTAQELQKYTKNGDMNRCFVPNQNPKQLPESDPKANNIEFKPYAEQLAQMEVVCAASFPFFVDKYMECKTPESYCYVCCESEFGQLHLSDREKCYNKRCNKK